MDLFGFQPEDNERNLLPYQGKVNYFGPVLSSDEADESYQHLLSLIEWQRDQAILSGKGVEGKKVTTKRKYAWYADQPYKYTYSQVTREAKPWIPELLSLKSKVEALSGDQFNACLLNLYHDGSETMAWHSDAEKQLKENATVASLSLGAERKFSFKHKQTKETVSLQLQHGSLLLMKGVTQKHWLHRLPQSTKVTEPRINLTFRLMNTARNQF